MLNRQNQILTIVSSSRGLTAGRGGTSRGSPKVGKLVPRFPSRGSPEIHPAVTSIRDTFSSREVTKFNEKSVCPVVVLLERRLRRANYRFPSYIVSGLRDPGQIVVSRGCRPAVPPRSGNPSRGSHPAVPQILEDTMILTIHFSASLVQLLCTGELNTVLNSQSHVVSMYGVWKTLANSSRIRVPAPVHFSSIVWLYHQHSVKRLF